MSLHPSHDLGVWVAAALTLCIFSFLYKDNPFYKFAEHLFVGVSAGYYLVLSFWTVLVANLWDPLLAAFNGSHGSPLAARLGDYRAFLLLPALLGLLLFSRFVPRVSWLARWSLALIIGAYAGLKTTGFAQGDFVAQVQEASSPCGRGSGGRASVPASSRPACSPRCSSSISAASTREPSAAPRRSACTS